jgi:imidazolonepropionase-like amidohydrolase
VRSFVTRHHLRRLRRGFPQRRTSFEQAVVAKSEVRVAVRLWAGCRLPHDASVDTVDRVAGLLLLLFAQPLARTATITLTSRELALATHLTHDAGRPVATHAYTPAGIRDAVQAGTDTIEHASFLDADTAARVAEGGQILVPTITAYADHVAAPVHLGLPTAAVAKAARALEAGKAAIASALAHSIPIAAGSDAGGRATTHGCLAAELDHLVNAGLSPADVYAAATSIAARACGITDAGELRPGSRADIIGTDHNPAVQVGTLHHVRTVIAAGRVIT